MPAAWDISLKSLPVAATIAERRHFARHIGKPTLEWRSTFANDVQRRAIMRADPSFTDVFVSHSSQDTGYAVAVVDFLHKCFTFKDYEITCTSAPRYGLSGGAEFERDILKSISKCSVFIALLSANSLASTFCLMEMGAAWGRKKPFKPILLPGTLNATVPRPLSSMNFLLWTEPSDWQKLAYEIHEKTGASRINLNLWERHAAEIASYPSNVPS